MVADEICSTPFGEFELHRNLSDRTGTLRAWDGADLLLLEHVASLNLGAKSRILVVGDMFGALSIPLTAAGFDLVHWCDSRAAEHAIEMNRSAAGLATTGRTVSDVAVVAELGPFDVVVWNVDRITDLVAEVLSGLIDATESSSVVFAAGMDKYLPPRTAEILRSSGIVTTHPGRRKAHVFELRVRPGDARIGPVMMPRPASVSAPEHELVLVGAPGVFSADRYDLGTRLIVEQLRKRLPGLRLGTGGDAATPATPHIVDLGCGNGAFGIAALQMRPDAHVYFVDDSARAVACAKANVERNVGSGGLQRSTFLWSDVFADAGEQMPPKVDLVVCNPPFHQAGAVTDEIALRMFVGSRGRLRPSAELWVVANRSLGYHAVLGRTFEQVRPLGRHPKYVLLAACGHEPKPDVFRIEANPSQVWVN